MKGLLLVLKAVVFVISDPERTQGILGFGEKLANENHEGRLLKSF